MLTTASVDVQVTDNDVLAIVPSSSTLVVTEGASGTFTVTLTQVPTGTVTVALASSAPALAAPTPATLTFTTGNWNVGQNVTVNAPHDVDVTDDGAVITLAATGLVTRSVAIAIEDDDTQIIVASPATAVVPEGGATTINVRLGFAPRPTSTSR